MTYNTGNPIGSTDARDRSDNSENLDLAVNSLSQTFVDRLGVTRDTLEGIYQKSAYYRAGTFDAGYTLTNNRQTLAYGNIEYSWSGAFPKVVAAGSTPASTGGVGAGAWVDRTDVTLRSELESPSGSTLVYNGSDSVAEQLNRLLTSDLGVFHVDNYGAVGNGDISGAGTVGNVISGTPDTAAIQSAIAAAELAGGGIIKFTPYKSYRITYSLLFGSNLVFDFQGARIIWDCPTTAPEASFLLGKYYNMGNDTDYSDNVIIRDLRLVTGYQRGNGIGLPKCRNILVDNVRTEYCYLHTVDATGTKNCVIQRVYADSASALAHLQVDVATGPSSVSGADSAGNYLYCAYDASGTAIWSYADNCFLRYCYVTNNLHSGIHIHNSGARRVFIDNCYVSANQRGIHTDDGGYVISLWITNSTIRNNNTYELYLQANHREVYVANCIIGNDSRDTGSTLELVTMRASATNLAQRLSVAFIGNKFSGRYRGLSIQYIQDVLLQGNEFRAMGNVLTASDPSAAVSFCANVFQSNNVLITGNVVYDCLVDGALVVNTCGHVAVNSNAAQSSGALVKLLSCTNSVVDGNRESPLAAAVSGSYFGACTRLSVSNHQSVMASLGTAAALYFAGGVQLYANNCSVDNTNTGAYGILATGGASLRTSCNSIRTVTTAIRVEGATSITCHEPFISATNIINGGTGTITYNTFTTSVK